MVSEFTHNGNTVNVPVYINEHAQFNRVFIDVNKISTVFDRDNFRDFIARQVRKQDLVRIKNRSIQSSERNALIAKGYRQDASFDANVAQVGADVKQQFSLSDSEGKQLTKEQQDFIKIPKLYQHMYRFPSLVLKQIIFRFRRGDF